MAIEKDKGKKRFANVVLVVLAIATFIFVIANMISFWFFQIEQTALISAWFGCVGVELVALISKRISDNKYDKQNTSLMSGENYENMEGDENNEY